MLEPTPAPDPCDRDIHGNAVPMASQHTAQEHENGPGHISQDMAHNWSAARSEDPPGYSRLEVSVQEQAVGNGETQAGGNNSGKE
jgi:hypothetical protein